MMIQGQREAECVLHVPCISASLIQSQQVDRVLVKRLTVAWPTVHNRANNSPPPSDILSQINTVNSLTPMSVKFILIIPSNSLPIPVKPLTMHDQPIPSTHTASLHHKHQPQQWQVHQDTITGRGTDWRRVHHNDLYCSPVFTPVIGRPKCRWNHIKLNLTELGIQGVDRIHLARNRHM